MDYPIHDIQVAFFKIQEESEQLVVNIKFEEEDLLNALEVEKIDLNLKMINDYLSEHFKVKINGVDFTFELESFNMNQNHLYIKALLPSQMSQVRTMEITNTCLLNIEDHSNVIEIYLNAQERGFLMNKERTVIHINL